MPEGIVSDVFCMVQWGVFGLPASYSPHQADSIRYGQSLIRGQLETLFLFSFHSFLASSPSHFMRKKGKKTAIMKSPLLATVGQINDT